ncbi:MAG: choice-of-anchor L domain-containing protein, partial [Bacteroidia bacterium]
MKIQLKYLVALCFFTLGAKAQLLVSNNSSASTLVDQIVGNNVTITNPVLKCNPSASGLFLTNNSNLGLNNGIILATGNASGAMGPNNDTKHGTCFDANSSFYDPQLSAIEPNATYDGCVLEFDIKPICNTLQIRYVFGSEEYPEYVDSKYNDIFGFFITGPNPAGGSYSAQNIAKLSTGAAVAINNVNNGHHNAGPCMNCSYYVDNTGSSTIQYDGMTTPLTASVNVTPCQTYHLKLAIADAGDCDYDSGVFLEYKGISCANSQIPAVASNTTVSLCDLNNGSATANVTNYAGSVSYVWSPGGQTGATATNLAPGNYICTMSFQLPCPYTKTVAAVVPHNAGFTFSNAITNIKCPQDVNGSATVTPTGGNSPYNYSWNTSTPQTSASANGLGLGTYICTISDAAGCVKKDSVKIFASTTLASAPTASSALCTNSTGIAYANATGGVAPYTYSWSTTPVQTASSATSLFPGTYSVTVTDKDGCIKTAAVTVNDFFPTILLNDSIVHTTCGQSDGAIYIGNITGGTN